MKRIFSILAIATLMSCTPETVTVDCNGQTIAVGSKNDYKIGATICR